jgi:hypothetical protein
MSTAAHSSHDDGLKWSREEISAWLDAQCPELQKTCRELGRKWAQEGRDLVAGFNIVRYVWEKDFEARAQAARQPRQPAIQSQSSAPGFLGVVQDYYLARQEARIYDNLANMDQMWNGKRKSMWAP